MTKSPNMLDAAEYLHLAIHASQENNHHAALNYLGQALALEPDNAAVRYFLAAEHAELGLLERARQGMEEALKLDPNLDMARFQLGLLYTKLQLVIEARDNFTELAERTDDPSLRSFSLAFLALLDEDQPKATSHLKEGLASCENNPALKGDMERVLANISEPAPAQPVDAESKSADTAAVFLGAYRDSLDS